MLVERDRLMILVIVGRTDNIVLREVGIGSKSQLVSGDSESSSEIGDMSRRRVVWCVWWSNRRRNMRRRASKIEEKTGV